MSQNLQKISSVPVRGNSSVRINRFFDKAELIVERSGALISKSKLAVLNLFLLVHLIVDLIIVLVFVLSK